MTTPSRRKRHVPDAAPQELIGAQLFVPAEVFPKEEPPRGKSGWKAVVTGYNKANHDEIFVRFPGFGSEQYFFPLASVKEWLVQPSVQQQQQRSKAAARAATGPSPAVPPPSPAKSTAARRSSVQPRASQAGDTAGPSGEGDSQDQGQQEQQPATAAGGESPRGRGRPRRRSAAGGAAKAAAPPEEEEDIQEEPEQPSSEEGSEQVVGGSEEEEEEGGRAPKRRRTQDAAVPGVTVRDVVNFCAGSVMTYVLLRFMYPAELD